MNDWNLLLIELDKLEIAEMGKKEALERLEQEQNRENYTFNLEERLYGLKKIDWNYMMKIVATRFLNGDFKTDQVLYLMFDFTENDVLNTSTTEKQLLFDGVSKIIEEFPFDSKKSPFLFQKPAYSHLEKVRHITSDTPTEAIYISPKVHLEMVEILKRMTLVFVRHIIFDACIAEKEITRELLPDLLKLISLPHVVNDIKFYRIFGRIFHLFKQDELILKTCQDWYQHHNFTFAHQPVGPYYDSIESCLYLLNPSQIEEVKIYFYFEEVKKIEKFKNYKKNMKSFDKNKLDKIQRMKTTIMKIKSW